MTSLDDEIAAEARRVVLNLLEISDTTMEGLGYGLSNETWDSAQYLLSLLDRRAALPVGVSDGTRDKD